MWKYFSWFFWIFSMDMRSQGDSLKFLWKDCQSGIFKFSKVNYNFWSLFLKNFVSNPINLQIPFLTKCAIPKSSLPQLLTFQLTFLLFFIPPIHTFVCASRVMLQNADVIQPTRIEHKKTFLFLTSCNDFFSADWTPRRPFP